MNWSWARSLPSKVTPWNTFKYGGAVSLVAGVPLMAYAAGKSQHGEALEDAVGAGAGIASYPAMATLAAGAVSLIPGVGPVTRVAAPLIGLVLAHSPAERITKGFAGAVRTFTSVDHMVRGLESGQGYRDTETNQRLRARAIQEMSGTMVSARRQIGREAELMHR